MSSTMCQRSQHDTPSRPVRLRQLVVEIIVVASVFIAYRQARLLTEGEMETAQLNAQRIVSLERHLHIFTEGAVQSVASDYHAVILFLNRYYVLVHFPITVLFLSWLFLRHPGSYRRIRNWFVAVTATALAVHIAFPLAPPRLMPNLGLVDTLQQFGPRIYSADTTASAANQIAAMPSLHVGWAFMVAVGVVLARQDRRSWIAFAHPAITLLAVVATANHYWLDGVCALALAGLGWLVVKVLHRPAGLALKPATLQGPAPRTHLTMPPRAPLAAPYLAARPAWPSRAMTPAADRRPLGVTAGRSDRTTGVGAEDAPPLAATDDDATHRLVGCAARCR